MAARRLLYSMGQTFMACLPQNIIYIYIYVYIYILKVPLCANHVPVMCMSCACHVPSCVRNVPLMCKSCACHVRVMCVSCASHVPSCAGHVSFMCRHVPFVCLCHRIPFLIGHQHFSCRLQTARHPRNLSVSIHHNYGKSTLTKNSKSFRGAHFHQILKR